MKNRNFVLTGLVAGCLLVGLLAEAGERGLGRYQSVFSDLVDASDSQWYVWPHDDGDHYSFWHVTDRRSQSTAYSWWYGQEETGTYETGSDPNVGYIESPIITLSGSGCRLVFNHYLETENHVGADLAKIMIAPAPSAPTEWRQLFLSRSTHGAWKKETIDISKYDGKSVTTAFVFDTVDDWYNFYEGWFVDDIRVECISPTTK